MWVLMHLSTMFHTISEQNNDRFRITIKNKKYSTSMLDVIWSPWQAQKFWSPQCSCGDFPIFYGTNSTLSSAILLNLHLQSTMILQKAKMYIEGLLSYVKEGLLNSYPIQRNILEAWEHELFVAVVDDDVSNGGGRLLHHFWGDSTGKNVAFQQQFSRWGRQTCSQKAIFGSFF